MGYSEQLTGEELVRMYRWMVLTRALEDRLCALWGRGGMLELPHGSQGQEAIAVGACCGLRQDDQVLPSLRTRGAFLVRGIPTRVYMAGAYARVTGPAHGKATSHHMGDPTRGVLVGSGLVGASITVATGAALAIKLQKRDAVVVDFFGDGAAQRGDFHEALNFAGVFKLPVIFVLENNQYSEYTPLAKHFAGTNFACRAEGYGFPGLQVDGNDVLAVYDSVQEAVARARAGKGPTLLECITYRHRAHAEIDPPEAFRDPAEIELWLARDPIQRFRADLVARGILSETVVEQILAGAEAEVDEAIQYAESSPFPDVDELYRDVYGPDGPEVVAGRRG